MTKRAKTSGIKTVRHCWFYPNTWFRPVHKMSKMTSWVHVWNHCKFGKRLNAHKTYSNKIYRVFRPNMSLCDNIYLYNCGRYESQFFWKINDLKFTRKKRKKTVVDVRKPKNVNGFWCLGDRIYLPVAVLKKHWEQTIKNLKNTERLCK